MSWKNSKNNQGPVKWLWKYEKKQIGYVMGLAVLGMMLSASFIVLALVSSQLIDVVTGAKEGSVELLISAVFVLIILQGVLNILYSNVRVRVSSRLEMKMRRRLFASLLQKDYQDMKKIHSGELLNRMTSDVEIVVNGITLLIPQALSLMTKLLAGLGVLLVMDWRFTCLVMALGGVVAAGSRIFSSRFRHLHRQVQETNGRVRSFVQECLENVIVIKSFANETAINQKLDNLHRENYKIRLKRNAVSNFTNTCVYIVFTVGYYAALAWGAFGIVSGRFTFGTLTAFLQIISQIRSPMRNISGLIPQYYSMLGSAERLMEIEKLKSEKVGERIEDMKTFQEEFLGIKGEHITFRYDEDETVLEDVSFFIPKGTVTAIMGESGAGKSSLMKLMLSIQNPEKGELFLECKNSRIRINPGVRNAFSYVPQGNLVLSGTIRENLVFGREHVSKEEIEQAAKAACIWEEIQKLPDGLDTVLLERGIGLSEGQIQRITIARALIADAPILLLDECTSALDQDTEKLVIQNLKNLKNKTILCISHRSAILEYCDQVLEIEKKKVKEDI